MCIKKSELQLNSMNAKSVLLCWPVVLAFIILFTACTRRVDQNFTEPRTPVAEQILTRIKASSVGTEIRPSGESICERVALTDFYARRLYHPAWSDNKGPTRLVDDLVKSLDRADLEGLRPGDYHLAAIKNLLAAIRSDIQDSLVVAPDQLAELDLLLTDAFLMYGSHLLFGRVNPETINPKWIANQKTVDLASVLEATITSGKLTNTLTTLAPTQLGFRRLREALVHYRELASKGGWPTIPDGPTLKRGDYGSRVAALRERLSFDGDLTAPNQGKAALFDDALVQALQQFQRRHGLNADGIMDAATRAELNVSAERRVEQLELNLERWRWLPQDLGRRYLLVNIPAFKLEVVEDEAFVLGMRIVVGTTKDTTPILNATVEYMFINPYWNVPRDMVLYEMLPRIQHDSSYLARQNFHVLTDSGGEDREVSPDIVNWSSITPNNFPYRLRQEPGPHNGMGRIKFIFPNKFDVYLHDTPGRHLFEQQQRTFSHGCIRIERPIDLAVYLLRPDQHWNRDVFLRELEKKVPTSVVFPEKIPIYLVYWTAWADWDGTIQFRPDIYAWDALLSVAMRAPLPTKEVVGTQRLGSHGG